jgi:hypothetical protein
LLDDWQPQAVGELVDEDEVADLERGPHRRGRNLERLGDEGTQQENDQQYRKEALRILDPPGPRASGSRRFAKTSLSASAMHPVATVARKRISAKFIVGGTLGDVARVGGGIVT